MLERSNSFNSLLIHPLIFYTEDFAFCVLFIDFVVLCKTDLHDDIGIFGKTATRLLEGVA